MIKAGRLNVSQVKSVQTDIVAMFNHQGSHNRTESDDGVSK